MKNLKSSEVREKGLVEIIRKVNVTRQPPFK